MEMFTDSRWAGRVRKLAHATMGETTLPRKRAYGNSVSFCASPKGDDRTRSRVMLTKMTKLRVRAIRDDYCHFCQRLLNTKGFTSNDLGGRPLPLGSGCCMGRIHPDSSSNSRESFTIPFDRPPFNALTTSRHVNCVFA